MSNLFSKFPELQDYIQEALQEGVSQQKIQETLEIAEKNPAFKAKLSSLASTYRNRVKTPTFTQTSEEYKTPYKDKSFYKVNNTYKALPKVQRPKDITSSSLRLQDPRNSTKFSSFITKYEVPNLPVDDSFRLEPSGDIQTHTIEALQESVQDTNQLELKFNMQDRKARKTSGSRNSIKNKRVHVGEGSRESLSFENMFNYNFESLSFDVTEDEIVKPLKVITFTTPTTASDFSVMSNSEVIKPVVQEQPIRVGTELTQPTNAPPVIDNNVANQVAEQNRKEAERLASERKEKELKRIAAEDAALKEKERQAKAKAEAEAKQKAATIRAQEAAKARREAEDVARKAAQRNPYDGLPKANLFSFDTETTGVDTKKAKMWQMGYAEKNSITGQITGEDVHVNPGLAENLSKDEMLSQMRAVNGKFSEDSYQLGHFNRLADQYVGGTLDDTTSGVQKTLGKIQKGSILVMQNMNFENNLLREAMERGDILRSMYFNMQDNMHTVGADSITGLAGDELFQRPFKVQEAMREADFNFFTKFSKTHTKRDFDKYLGHLNRGFDEYNSILKNLTPSSKIPVVELMDISKIFLGNLASTGLIEKETARLGLNVNFLTQALFNRAEEHTAFSDSKDTIEVFEKLYQHTEELRQGKVSDELRRIAKNIVEQQPEEVNRQFKATIKSTLEDFKSKGMTKMRASTSRFYSPEVSVIEDGVLQKSNSISIGRQAENTTNLEAALRSQIERYDTLYAKNIGGFDRDSFVQDIVRSYDPDTKNYSDLIANIEKTELPKVIGGPSTTIVNKSGQLLESSFNKGNKAMVAVAAVAGLAYMAFRSPPPEKEENNEPVYENFYDPQYLGTGFVEFRDRNKRYVY